MNNLEIMNQIFEVRDYFIKLMPQEGSKELEILDLLDMIIDVELWEVEENERWF